MEVDDEGDTKIRVRNRAILLFHDSTTHTYCYLGNTTGGHSLKHVIGQWPLCVTNNA